MLHRLVLFGVLSSFVAVTFITVQCSSREDWLDPTDMHNYDHANKRMKKSLKQSTGATGAFQVNDELAVELSACKTKLETILEGRQYSYEFLLHLLQRQTAIVLKAANLEDYVGNENQHYVTRHLRLTLDQKQLRTLKEFARTGSFAASDLDSAWQSMLEYERDPDYSFWHSLPSITISKETFILVTVCSVALIPIILIFFDVPLLRVLLIFIFLGFILSFGMKITRTMQANEVRLHHMKIDPSQMPKECRPSSQRSWWEFFATVFNTEDAEKEKCAKYYEENFSDPLTHHAPVEQFVDFLLDINDQIFARFGGALRRLNTSLFSDLPWPLNILVSSVANILIILFIMVLVILIMYSRATGLLHPSYRYHQPAAPTNAPLPPGNSEALPGAQPPALVNIFLMNQQDSTVPGVISHPALANLRVTRTQSDGLIALSSESSVGVPSITSSDRDSRNYTRSASEGNVLRARKRKPNPESEKTQPVFSIPSTAEHESPETPGSDCLMSLSEESEMQLDSSPSAASSEMEIIEDELPKDSCEESFVHLEAEKLVNSITSETEASRLSLSPMRSELSTFLDQLQMEDSLHEAEPISNEPCGGAPSQSTPMRLGVTISSPCISTPNLDQGCQTFLKKLESD